MSSHFSRVPGQLSAFLFVLLLVLSGCAGTDKRVGTDNLAKASSILADPGADKKQAFDAFVAACNSGNNYGCFKVGVAYNKGLYGVPVNVDEAIVWYLKAANRGFIPAQQNIANLYAYRQVKRMDDIEGYKWLELAQRATARCEVENIAAENDISIAELKRLCALAKQGQLKIQSVFRKRMNMEEVKQAEDQAQAWVKKY